MKKIVITIIMLVIFLFALSTGVQAYTMTFTGTNKTPTVVEAGDTFNVVVTVDEQTVLANGHLSFNESLFTFIGATQANMVANVENLNWIALEGVEHINKVKWMYTDLSSNLESGAGTKTFVFTFQAADVSEEKTGRFTLDDFVVTTADDNSYDNNETTAADEKIQGSNYIDVTIKTKSETPTPDDWSLTPSGEVSIKKGETKQITVNGDVEVEWSSSDTSVATVDKNGKITAVGKGTAYITATKKGGAGEGVSAQRIKVTVTEGDKEEDKIKFEPSEDFTIEKGKTTQIKISGAEGTVTWKSSNEKVATVDKDGKVTAIGAGTAIITATDAEGNTKSIVVNVKDNSKKDENNSIKDNSALPGKKDNTLTPDSNLPKTGEDFGKFLILSLTAIIFAAALIFKSKAKKLNKLFIIIPFIASISVCGIVNAGKFVDNDVMKAGIYFGTEKIIDEASVIAVSPSQQFTTSDKVTLEMIKSIPEDHFVKIYDKDGEEIVNPEFIATGYTVKSFSTADNWKVVIYGDANGDGNICNAIDIDVIRQDYVFGYKAEGVNKEAADIYRDGNLNVRDIQRMVKKYIGTLDGSLVTPFPGDCEIATELEIFSNGMDYTGAAGVILLTDVIGERFDSQTYFYKEANDETSEFIELMSSDESVNLFTPDVFEQGKEYEVKALVRAKNGEDYETNTIKVVIPLAPEIHIESNGNHGTIISVSSPVDEPITNYSFVITKAGESEPVYTTEGGSSRILVDNLEDGNYTVKVTLSTELGIKLQIVGIKDFTVGNVKPPLTINVEPVVGGTTFDISVLSPTEIDQIESYRFVITKDGDENPIKDETTTDSEIQVSNLTEGVYTIEVIGITTNGDVISGKATFTSSGPTGETENEEEAVAKVLSTEKMYTSLQAAINALEDDDELGGRITLLQDIIESIEIPDGIDAVIDVNGHSITGERRTEYTIKVANSDFCIFNLNSLSDPQSPYIIAPEGNLVNILLEGGTGSRVYLGENIQCIVRTPGAINVKNNGANNLVQIDGADLKCDNEETETVGIKDDGTNSDITILRGTINQDHAIIKSQDYGNITIGENLGEIYEDKEYLYINGTTCITTEENTTINFYNGRLESKGENTTVCMSGDSSKDFSNLRQDISTETILCGGTNQNKAFYRIRNYLGGYAYLTMGNFGDFYNYNYLAAYVQFMSNGKKVKNIEWYYKEHTADNNTDSIKIGEGKDADMFLYKAKDFESDKNYIAYAVVTTEDDCQYKTNERYFYIEADEENGKHYIDSMEIELSVYDKDQNGNMVFGVNGDNDIIDEVEFFVIPEWHGHNTSGQINENSKISLGKATETSDDEMFLITVPEEEILEMCNSGLYCIGATIKTTDGILYETEEINTGVWNKIFENESLFNVENIVTNLDGLVNGESDIVATIINTTYTEENGYEITLDLPTSEGFDAVSYSYYLTGGSIEEGKNFIEYADTTAESNIKINIQEMNAFVGICVAYDGEGNKEYRFMEIGAFTPETPVAGTFFSDNYGSWFLRDRNFYIDALKVEYIGESQQKDMKIRPEYPENYDIIQNVKYMKQVNNNGVISYEEIEHEGNSLVITNEELNEEFDTYIIKALITDIYGNTHKECTVVESNYGKIHK